MSSSHILSIPWNSTVINDVATLTKYYNNMMVLFCDNNTGLWCLSIQSKNNIQQLSNSSDLINSTGYLYMRSSSGIGFGSFINQSLQGAGIDDSSESPQTVYSSTKLVELLNSVNINNFSTLQTGDIMYDDRFKYIATKDTSGKITFDLTGFNTSFTDTSFNIENTFNTYNVVNLSGFLNDSTGDYIISCNIENISNSFNNLTLSSESVLDFQLTKQIDNCFNGTNPVILPPTVENISNSFNNINATDSTITILDSSIYDMSNCFVNSSANFVIFDPLLDISANFIDCSGTIIVETTTTHPTLEVKTFEDLTLIEYTDRNTMETTVFTPEDLSSLKNLLEQKDYYDCVYDNLELQIYAWSV